MMGLLLTSQTYIPESERVVFLMTSTQTSPPDVTLLSSVDDSEKKTKENNQR